jgi:hypothetical protein
MEGEMGIDVDCIAWRFGTLELCIGIVDGIWAKSDLAA